MNIIVIALFAIVMIAIAKYKPVYEVKINDKEVGYITNRYEFEKKINQELLETEGQNVASSQIEANPEYELKLVSHSVATNENEILKQLESSVKTIYKRYAITLNGETTEYVDTFEQAENVVSELRNQYDEETMAKVGITEVYTENKEEVTQYMMAKVNTGDLIRQSVAEEAVRESQTFKGVYFSKKPVTGRISSRFGSKESIRTSAHKGIDIAAPNGTPIYAAADGVVKTAGMNNGGYGNLVVIDHGNGVETYYGHCSRIYTKVGRSVKAGDKIAAVGSTGRSTGNHLHFEIRNNGSQINPQKYLYK